MKNTANLTTGHDPETVRSIALTVDGMAHFSGTGPLGATCGECAFYGCRARIVKRDGTARLSFRRNACAKFFALTGKYGPSVPEKMEAYRHFVRRNDARP